MILDQLFEAVGEDSTAQRVADMLRQTHPNPSEATEREILAATSRVLSDQGMRDVQVRFYLRDPDFQSDTIEAVQALLQGVSEKIDLGPRLETKRDQGKILRKMRQSRLGEQGVAENTVKGKPFQKTMVRPEETYKLLAGQEPKAFAIDVLMPDQSAVKRLQAAIGNQAKIRVDDSITGDGIGIQIVTPVFPDGLAAQQAFEMMMDLIRTHGGEFNRSTGAIIATPASQGMAEAMKPSDIPPAMRDRLTMRDIEKERPQGAYRFRVTFPDGATADFMDFEAAKQRADADRGRISRLSEEKSPSARIERILKMLRAQHPQAENDLEALIFDFRSQQAQDRSDIARLDAENDMEEADIQRLERMLDLIKKRRGAIAEPASTNESLRDDEYHVATVTLDDGSVKKVRITSDEGFRDQIAKHFRKQGREVRDIDVDYAVRSQLDENKPTFTGAPNRPQQSVPVATRMMPPAPGRPTMTGGPGSVPRSTTPASSDLRIQETNKKPQPTNPELWSRAKAAARSKFDVYPSAYANAWAAKWYKSKGGGWRMGKPKKD